MAKRGLPPAHPGVHLGEEIKELGLTANAFAEAIGVPSNRIYQVSKPITTSGTRSARSGGP